MNKKINITFAIFGLLFGVIAFFLWSGQIELVKTGVHSSGAIVGISNHKSDKGTMMYAPIVEYEFNNTKNTFVSKLSTSNPGYKIGESVKILIPKNGNQPQINSFISLWFAAIVTSFLSLTFLIAGILFFIRDIKVNKNNEILKSRGVLIKATNPIVINGFEDKIQFQTTGLLSLVSNFRKRTNLLNKIKTQWLNPEDGKVYIFYSEYLNYDPTPYLGETVDIKILPENPSVYKFENIPQSAKITN